jgi:hypothetical protein
MRKCSTTWRLPLAPLARKMLRPQLRVTLYNAKACRLGKAKDAAKALDQED